jgi:hypothetical protein
VARAFALLAVLIPGATSCGEDPAGFDVDEDSLQTIPALEDLDFATIEPAAGWDYWELRHTLQGSDEPDEVLGTGGSSERDDLSATAVAALDAARSVHGFATGCLPGHCFDYIVALDGDAAFVFATTDALRSFLGDLESLAEAALMVHGLGFTWTTEPGPGYRDRSGGGWDFVVLELVETCAPVQTDRVVLRVEPAEPVTEIERAVWRTENVCI